MAIPHRSLASAHRIGPVCVLCVCVCQYLIYVNYPSTQR